MEVPSRYGIASYNVSRELLTKLTTLNERKSNWAIAQAWISIFALIYAMRLWVPQQYFWIVYVPAVFLIAGRFGALLQLIHEGSHGLLSRDKKLLAIFPWAYRGTQKESHIQKISKDNMLAHS